MILLSRDEFRNSVLRRDNNKCVICFRPAKDAHHIIERRLFDDGGYYLDNGASLCEEHHILAEKTTLSCEEIRKAVKIEKVVLPQHLYPDYEYDKWGNIINSNGTRVKGELFFDSSVQKILESGNVLNCFGNYIKYPRTFHLPWSEGKTNDDRSLKNCLILEKKKVIITTKMDGENTTGYWDGYIHARSLDSRNHESRNWVKNFLAPKLFNLPNNWRICGENLFAKHSIYYSNLKSYFYLFSIWNEKNECLSWNETIEWAELLGLTMVPTLYYDIFNEKLIREATPNFVEKNEGFVIRNSDKFSYAAFRKNVAKFVRKDHIVNNKHWIKTKLIKNVLAK